MTASLGHIQSSHMATSHPDPGLELSRYRHRARKSIDSKIRTRARVTSCSALLREAGGGCREKWVQSRPSGKPDCNGEPRNNIPLVS